jgi:PhnB protein
MTKAGERSGAAPDGWPTVVPRIVAKDAKRLVAFLRKVFGATGRYRATTPSEIRIGDSLLMISEVGVRGPTPAFLYVYVKDADATCRRALAAGARSLEEPAIMPYGDRRGMFEDTWGNIWQVATRVATSHR